MHIYIKYTMMINLKTFLKTLFEKYKRIVLANSTRTLEGPFKEEQNYTNCTVMQKYKFWKYGVENLFF